MEYIKLIKKYRELHHFTQIEMSKKLGLSPSAYGLYETGQRQMDINTFIRVCKILEVTPNEILGFDD